MTRTRTRTVISKSLNTHSLRTWVLPALLLSVSVPAMAAQTPADLRTHGQIQDVNPDLYVPQADTALSSALESYFIDGRFDDAVRDEFAPGVLLTFRHAYARRIFDPIWTREGAEAFKDSLSDLFEQGIVADEVFEKDIEALVERRFQLEDPEARALADVNLSLAYLRAAQAVSGGLEDEGGVANPKLNGPMRYNLTESLIQAGKGHVAQELETLEPNHKQYKALKKTLQNYRQMFDEGGWLAIPEGDTVEPGERDPRMPALRTRLEAEGFMPREAFFPMFPNLDLTPTAVSTEQSEESLLDATLLDESLVAALKQFQGRHGLEKDGILGNNTIEALNESVSSKIDRIADTMARWRHQGDMGERYIWANTPSYTAEGWDAGVREISMRTVVGKARHATPEFSDTVDYMVANPKWYVPVSITRRQKLPKMRQDPAYANKNNYTIFDRATNVQVDAFDVDWAEPGVARKYRFVQGSGEGNALGEMKIIFPNQYSVYLHGSPATHLFDRAQRAFSSGCVRLEDPGAMAKWIARGDAKMTPLEVKAALESDERKRFELDTQLPVHITYFTVTTNDDGSVNFWRDVYDRDDGIEYVEKYAKPVVKTANLKK